MGKNIVRQILIIAVVAWLGIDIAGCSKGIEGKYVGPNGAVSVEFKSGKAILNGVTGESEMDDYTVDGDKITVKTGVAGNNIVFTQNSDGSLEAMGMKFTKAAS